MGCPRGVYELACPVSVFFSKTFLFVHDEAFIFFPFMIEAFMSLVRPTPCVGRSEPARTAKPSAPLMKRTLLTLAKMPAALLKLNHKNSLDGLPPHVS